MLAFGSNHDDERISQTTFTCGRIDQVILFQAVHFGFVGGKENVGGRAFLDLPRERAGSGKTKNDFIAGLVFINGGDFLERVRKAGGGEHGDFSSMQVRDRKNDDAEDKRFQFHKFLLAFSTE